MLIWWSARSAPVSFLQVFYKFSAGFLRARIWKAPRQSVCRLDNPKWPYDIKCTRTSNETYTANTCFDLVGDCLCQCLRIKCEDDWGAGTNSVFYCFFISLSLVFTHIFIYGLVLTWAVLINPSENTLVMTSQWHRGRTHRWIVLFR